MAQSTPPTLKHESLRGERNGARGERTGGARRVLAVGVRQPRGRQGATRWRTRVACSVYARVQLRGPWAMGYMGVKAYASLFFTF